MNVYPVILSGGVGTRLWPVSREAHPKQLHALTSPHTMIQETVLRVRGELVGDVAFRDPLVVCNRRHAETIVQQFEALDIAPYAVIAEPVGRNTAPAAALAALTLNQTGADGVLLLLPADHHITDVGAFREATARAAHLASEGYLVTYGIVPSRPETGYGYIRRGEPLPAADSCFAVDAFVEKPERERAESFLAAGTYYWNGGIFAVRSDVLIEEMARHCPAILDAARTALDAGHQSNRVYAPDARAFAACPAESIDYAVMEHTARAAVVPADMGWNDVGSWTAIHDVAVQDADGNTVAGDVILSDVRNSLVRASSRLVAVAGIDDVVVVETEDAILVTTRERAQSVKGIVTALKAAKRGEL